VSQDYLKGIEHGLEPGIPNIADQPWKVLEVAMKACEPWQRPRLYHDWALLYHPGRLTKRQLLDLKDWGLTTA
jgi:hypothetical protein